jgi:hypothetical protein
VVSVIPGAVTPDQVRQNAENVARDIPGGALGALKARGLIDEASPVST